MNKETEEKNVLEQSIIDFKKIQEMVAKNSENQITDILNEAVKKGLKDIITEAEDTDTDENEYEVEDADTDPNAEVVGQDDIHTDEPTDQDEPENVDVNIDVDDNEGEGMEPEEGDEEEDFDVEPFKTSDDEYDLTNTDVNDIIKVFKKITTDDSVIVKQLEKGKIELIDNETDGDYVIEINPEGGDEEVETEVVAEPEDETNEMVEEVTEECGADEMNEEEMIDEGSEIEVELDGEDDTVEEKNMTTSIGTNRRAGRMTQTRQEYAPGKSTNRDGSKLIAQENVDLKAKYDSQVKKLEEAYEAKFNTINEELSNYKETLMLFRDKIKEMAVLNNNLSKYTKLVTENATTKEEKLSILQRFANEANTIEQGNALFESVKVQLGQKLNESSSLNIDKQFSVNSNPGQQKITEKVIYQSKDLQDTINLINRMNKLK